MTVSIIVALRVFGFLNFPQAVRQQRGDVEVPLRFRVDLATDNEGTAFVRGSGDW
jgi:hypothetical protein